MASFPWRPLCPRAADDMPSVQAHVTEVQPDRYCRPPLFDKDGRPVDYLQTAHKDAEGAPPRDRAQGKGERFDFYQSSNRMAIECAFGILIRRWGVLWRKLRQRFDRRAPLIGALMRLHNFCIDERLVEERPSERDSVNISLLIGRRRKRRRLQLKRN